MPGQWTYAVYALSLWNLHEDITFARIVASYNTCTARDGNSCTDTTKPFHSMEDAHIITSAACKDALSERTDVCKLEICNARQCTRPAIGLTRNPHECGRTCIVWQSLLET